MADVSQDAGQQEALAPHRSDGVLLAVFGKWPGVVLSPQHTRLDRHHEVVRSVSDQRRPDDLVVPRQSDSGILRRQTRTETAFPNRRRRHVDRVLRLDGLLGRLRGVWKHKCRKSGPGDAVRVQFRQRLGLARVDGSLSR